MKCRFLVIATALVLLGCAPSAEEVAEKVMQKQAKQRDLARDYLSILCEKKGDVAKSLYVDSATNRLTESDAVSKYGSVDGDDYTGLVRTFYGGKVGETAQHMGRDHADSISHAYKKVIRESCIEAGMKVVVDAQ